MNYHDVWRVTVIWFPLRTHSGPAAHTEFHNSEMDARSRFERFRRVDFTGQPWTTVAWRRHVRLEKSAWTQPTSDGPKNFKTWKLEQCKEPMGTQNGEPVFDAEDDREIAPEPKCDGSCGSCRPRAESQEMQEAMA